ncbi:MAG: 3-methylornithine--L-lysine ligase PylC [Thermacetogeniaceae bacterium]
MKAVVVGGALQGCEAVYLGIKAGWSLTLIDRKESPAACGLCDKHIRMDVTAGGEGLVRILAQADLVIPALEDWDALKQLQSAAERAGVPLAHDPSAYAITASKKRSDALFAEHGIPAPRSWPECGVPAIAKPSESSGSRGVRRLDTKGEVAAFLESIQGKREDWVIQEFLEGKSYSIEVFGCGGCYLTVQVTDLEMDRGYDCRRVTAPTQLPAEKESEFHALAARIAEIVQLQGIMDVEVIDHEGTLKVLEIDARLPSQTPTAVLWSTGFNMLEALSDVFVHRRLPVISGARPPQAVIYEHIMVSSGKIHFLGEHIMTRGGPLRLIEGFFGADEAITDHTPGAGDWVATLIHRGETPEEAWERRCSTIEAICRQHRIPLPEEELNRCKGRGSR